MSSTTIHKIYVNKTKEQFIKDLKKNKDTKKKNDVVYYIICNQFLKK